MSLNPVVHSLHVYPIKSCAGISVSSLQLGPRGPIGDREWMLVDATSKLFLTQRELPQLSVVKTEVDFATRLVCVELPTAKLSLKLDTGSQMKNESQAFHVTIFKDSCLALDEGEECAQAFSDYLKRDVRLVRMHPDYVRRVNVVKHLPPSSLEPQAGFADGMPLLLVSLNSLEAVNQKLSQAMPINRFRPNIVISGNAPFSEDTWEKVEIGSLLLTVAKPSRRCVIVNVDQATGIREQEPLKTLSSFRRNEKGQVLFGQYLLHSKMGALHQGDLVKFTT